MKNIKIVVVFTLIISLLAIGIGFAAFSTTLSINGTASVAASSWNIYFSKIERDDTNSTSGIGTTLPKIGDNENAGSNTIDTKIDSFDVTFSKPNQKVVYIATVTNGGTYNAYLTDKSIGTPSCSGTGTNAANDASNVCDNITYTVTGPEVNSTLVAGSTATYTITIQYDDITDGSLLPKAAVTITIPESTLTYSQNNSNCIAKGSKIAMADGTTKNVEDIKLGDEVLGYNYYDGNISNTKVYSVISGKHVADVFTIKLENGNELQIVGFEYLFDTDKKEYIPINKDKYESAIGKNVMINNDGKISSSKIVSITHKIKEVEHYTMYTEKFINYIANNMIVNIDVDFVNDRYTIDDNFKVDKSKYNADIAKYGMYSYDDFKDVCSKEMFDKLVLKDFSIVVGKRLITLEELKNGVKVLQDEIDYYNNLQNN